MRRADGSGSRPITFYDLVKYPFIKEALDYFRSKNLTLDDLESDVGRKILNRSYERIHEAISQRKVTTDLSEDPEIEVLSFPISLLLLSILENRSLIYRYAVAESKRVGELLKNEDLDKLIWIAKNTFKWRVNLVEEELGDERRPLVIIHFIDYISHIPQSSKEWKLINKRLVKGYVFIGKGELARMLEEAVKKYIIRKCSERVMISDLPNIIVAFIERISREWSQYVREIESLRIIPKDVIGDIYPPCIKKLLEDLKSGKNLPHAARFALATFLLNIGMSVEEVIELFKATPDFNERIARYQVEHLAGLRGSRIKYSPYKCSNMRSLGLCVDLNGKLCKGIHHPLQYYFRIIGGKRSGAKQAH